MILITGASGFLGKHLVRYLAARGHTIRALYNSHPPAGEMKALKGVEWMQCDLLDIFAVEEAMAGVTDIYHCAAMVTFDPRQRDKMLHFNPESTANIVNQALEQGIRKMVYISSIAALGRTVDTKKEITEEEEWEESKYNSAYGTSKYLAEMEAWRGIGEGLNIAMVNPGIILGEGSKEDLSAELMKVVYKEFPFYSKGVNAWVDVKDAVKAVVLLMESDITGERYILNSGNISYKDMFTLMATALDKKPPRYLATPLMTNIAWRLLSIKSAITGKKSIITRETANTSNSICNYRNDKFLKAFPSFRYSPIKQTVNEMAQSFIRNR